VLLYDAVPTALEQSKQIIEENLHFLASKGKIAPAAIGKIASLITYTSDFTNCKADLFIEAIKEDLELKIELFNKLAKQNEKNCMLASNTSSLSISAIARQMEHPEQFVGLHFFNPATLMKLVELVSTDWTDKQIVYTIKKLLEKAGKTIVQCKDAPGFIVNRVARPYYIESLRLVEEKSSSFEQIDTLLEATGFKMGPFKLMDLIGNDINFSVSCSIYEQLNKAERLKPSYIQQQLVREGKWGKKSNQGYYTY
jgi:3-hydroxybutyryl-CoA dehydrogenase